MRFETSSGTTVTAPDERTIDEGLRQLSGDDAFAIVSKNELTYMQAAGTADGGFVLEFQEGDTDKHYVAAGGPHAVDKVSKAFRQYAVGDFQWREEFQWERQSMPAGKSGCAGAFILMALGLAGAIFLIA